MTPLHHAAMKGEVEILQMLIEAGSELNTQDKVNESSRSSVYVTISLVFCMCVCVRSCMCLSVYVCERELTCTSAHQLMHMNAFMHIPVHT